MDTKAKKSIARFAAFVFLATAFFGVLLSPIPTHALAAEEEAEGSLVLPASYEQYLDLNAPKDFAMSANYLAIADGNRIYLYPREGGKYRVYTQGIAAASFGKIQLEDDILYFTDAAMRLYRLDPTAEELKAESIGYTLANFIVTGEQIFGTTTMGNTSSLYALALDGSTDIPSETPLKAKLPAQLPMTCDGETLYYAFNNVVFAIDVATHEPRAGSLLDKLEDTRFPISICAYNGEMFFTDETGFYRADENCAELIDAAEDYSALTCAGDKLYCIKGDAVREYDPIAKSFTSYEINAESDSANRLNGAVTSARARDLLVTADAGNHRISVYNIATDTYSTVASPDFAESFMPNLIATDGTIIAVAAGARIYTCTYGDDEFGPATFVEGNVRGLACVYGSVYYVTDNKAYGNLESNIFRGTPDTPAALTSNVYGDLFVAYEHTGEVRKFAENEFLRSDSDGELLNITMPEGYTQFSADFEGNLYVLMGSELCRIGVDGTTPITAVNGADYVFGQPQNTAPVSFALGFEDGDIYFLFGNYIVKKDADIPTLSEIDASGVREEIFKTHGKAGLFIDIPAGTIGVRTDLDVFKETNPPYFPYRFYYRTETDMQGLLLATKDDYAIVVLYEIKSDTRVFTVNLFHIEEDRRRIVPEENYWLEEDCTMYLSSEVSGYFVPCLHDALADMRLARGTAVKVLGYVEESPEKIYALVEYTLEGKTQVTFVPASYLTEVAPIPSETGKYEPAWLKASKAGVTFTAEDGETIVITERTRAYFMQNEDGTYTARITIDGKDYTATDVAESMIDRGENDALRISLIVILSVIEIGIIGGYVYLLPRKKAAGKYMD